MTFPVNDQLVTFQSSALRKLCINQDYSIRNEQIEFFQLDLQQSRFLSIRRRSITIAKYSLALEAVQNTRLL